MSMECQALRCRPSYLMRRLAFLAAASLAFIAISETPSAGARSENRRCRDAYYNKIAEKYGRPWAYGDLVPADQKWWRDCKKKFDEDSPRKALDS